MMMSNTSYSALLQALYGGVLCIIFFALYCLTAYVLYHVTRWGTPGRLKPNPFNVFIQCFDTVGWVI